MYSHNYLMLLIKYTAIFKINLRKNLHSFDSGKLRISVENHRLLLVNR